MKTKRKISWNCLCEMETPRKISRNIVAYDLHNPRSIAENFGLYW